MSFAARTMDQKLMDRQTPRTLFGHFPWRFVLWTFLILAVVTASIPVYHHLSRPEGTEYTGYTYESFSDIFYYTNYIQQVKEGADSLRLYAFSVPHEPVLFNPPFFVLGKMAKIFSWSPIVAWHAGRIALLLPFLILLTLLLRESSLSPEGVKTATAFAVATGSLFMYHFEASTFVAILYSPLLVLTLTLTLLVMLCFIRSARSCHWTLLTGTIVVGCWVLQALSQPYVLLLWLTVPLCYVVLHYRHEDWGLWRSLYVIAPTVVGAGLGYSVIYWQTSHSTVLSAWAVNNVFAVSPSHIIYFLAPLLPFTVYGVLAERRRFAHDTVLRLLLLWSFVVILLYFSPYPYKERLLLFLHIPLAVFASRGAIFLWDFIRKSVSAQTVVIALLAVTIAGNLHHLYVNFTKPAILKREPALYEQFAYLDPERRRMFGWVRAHTPGDAVFLTAPKWDSLFQSFSHRFVYLTNGALTNDVSIRQQETREIYSGIYEPAALQLFLSHRGITHILLGGWEREVAAQTSRYERVHREFVAAQYPFLRVIYDQDGFIIYEVEYNSSGR